MLSMTHDPHLAEDVLQDTFVQLLISNVRLAPGKEQTWLYKVARNRCLDLLKKNRKHDELPPDVPADPDWNRTFIEMISPLTKSEQEIISLKFIGGFLIKKLHTSPERP
ncbi:RNA polymerase sigma factor [Mediterraneibacter catenae]|nr:RNA polymerase sigma factor [Mediterraneibacter catenae]